MSEVMDERVAVVAGPSSFGVTLSLGEVQITVRSPAPAGWAGMSAEASRAAAIRGARLALEVALEELTNKSG